MGLIDRLLNREPTAKAVSGTGAYWMEHGVPLRPMSRDPLRLIAEAQKVYHSNEWVHAAESLIDSKFATVAWHLERDGETVEEESDLTHLLRSPSKTVGRTHLWRITCRHLGLTGNAFWYLDQPDELGIPVEIIYLNPARMTPASDGRGALRGWIVDADRPNGVEPVPLDASEVMHFVLDPPDFGHYGIGKVESAWRKIGLSNASGSFAEGSLISGGRKAHMIWPGDGITVEGDAWDSWVNNLRNIQEDGSFTRRLTANRFAIGSLQTGQTITELKVPELSELARTDLLAHWGVPPSSLGITESRGLNSGETQKYEEAALWQNAIEPRLVPFAELLQARLVDPFGLTLVLETPEFDDDAPLYDLASKAGTVPHKVDELRALVHLDPLDEAVYGRLGQALLIDQKIVELSDNPPPTVIAPPMPVDDDATEMPNPGEISGKARLNLESIRRNVEKQYPPRLQRRVGEALAAQAAAVAAAVKSRHAHLAAKPNDASVWWDEQREYDRLGAALQPVLRSLIRQVGTQASAAFFAPVKAVSFMELVEQYVDQRVGDRIRSINDTTREAIREVISAGVAAGSGPAELATAISEATAFNAARAELIGRTETMLAYNDAALGTYRAFDVEQVQAIDGDADDVCAARNGNIYTLSEASGISDHPNGTLDWVPIVKAAEVSSVRPDDLAAILATIRDGFAGVVPAQPTVVQVQPTVTAPAVNVTLPEQAPPQVNVNLPEPIVNVAAAAVTVNVPEQAAPVVNVAAPVEAKATLPQEVIVTQMPRRVHSLIRDKAGKASGSVEDDA